MQSRGLLSRSQLPCLLLQLCSTSLNLCVMLRNKFRTSLHGMQPAVNARQQQHHFMGVAFSWPADRPAAAWSAPAPCQPVVCATCWAAHSAAAYTPVGNLSSPAQPGHLLPHNRKQLICPPCLHAASAGKRCNLCVVLTWASDSSCAA